MLSKGLNNKYKLFLVAIFATSVINTIYFYIMTVTIKTVILTITVKATATQTVSHQLC